MKKTKLRKLIRPVVSWYCKNTSIDYKILGSEYGAWPLPTELINKKVNLLTLGVGEDLSFELSASLSCELNLTCFDPTAKAKRYFECKKDLFTRPKFYQKAIVGKDSSPNFRAPDEPNHVSIYKSNSGNEQIDIEFISTTKLSKLLNLKGFDIIKMDIEGFEIEVLDDLLDQKYFPKFFLVEFHQYIYNECTMFEFYQMQMKLKKLGYKCFYVSKTGCEFGFTR